jgi:hypothetical protein
MAAAGWDAGCRTRLTGTGSPRWLDNQLGKVTLTV